MVEEIKKVKIILTGDTKTGKTNIINKFVHNKFTNDFISTIGLSTKE